MGLKSTILGWIHSDPDKSDELEDAEIDAADKEYSEQKAENLVQERFGSHPGEFEADGQSAPR